MKARSGMGPVKEVSSVGETTSTPHKLLEPWRHYQTRLRSMQGGVV